MPAFLKNINHMELNMQGTSYQWNGNPKKKKMHVSSR